MQTSPLASSQQTRRFQALRQPRSKQNYIISLSVKSPTGFERVAFLVRFSVEKIELLLL